MVVEEQPQRRAVKAELSSNAIFQEATVGKVNQRGFVYGENKGGRVRARLGDVVDAEPASLG